MSDYNLFNGYPGSKAPFSLNVSAFFNKDATIYVEPFVGGGGMFLSVPNGKFENVVINDKNYGIALLYKCLADDTRRDAALKALLSIERSPNKEMGREIWAQAKKEYIYDVRLAKKEDYVKNCVNAFTVYSQSFNSAGTSYSHHKSPEKYKIETKRNLLNVVETLKMRKNLTIRSTDALDVIEDYADNPKAQLMLDPPYVGLYSSSRDNYLVKMVRLKEHIEMLLCLEDCKASVVLCGYRPPIEGVPCIYDAMLSKKEGWHCFKVKDTVKKSEVVKPGTKKQLAFEYVWTNHVPENVGLYVSLYDYKEDITMDEYWERILKAYKNGLITPKDMLEYYHTYTWYYLDNRTLVNDEEFGEILKASKKSNKKK